MCQWNEWICLLSAASSSLLSLLLQSYFSFFFQHQTAIQIVNPKQCQLKYKLEKVTVAFMKSSSSWPLDSTYSPIVRIKNNAYTTQSIIYSYIYIYASLFFCESFLLFFLFFVDHNNVDRITKSKQNKKWFRFVFLFCC